MNECLNVWMNEWIHPSSVDWRRSTLIQCEMTIRRTGLWVPENKVELVRTIMKWPNEDQIMNWSGKDLASGSLIPMLIIASWRKENQVRFFTLLYDRITPFTFFFFTCNRKSDKKQKQNTNEIMHACVCTHACTYTHIHTHTHRHTHARAQTSSSSSSSSIP